MQGAQKLPEGGVQANTSNEGLAGATGADGCFSTACWKLPRLRIRSAGYEGKGGCGGQRCHGKRFRSSRYGRSRQGTAERGSAATKQEKQTEKSKPKKSIIVAIWFFIGGVIGVGGVFGKLYLKEFRKKWAIRGNSDTII